MPAWKNWKPRFHAAIRIAHDAAGGKRIGTTPLPRCMIDRRILVEHRPGRIDQLEQPAALKIGPHGRGNDARHGRIAGEIGDRHRNAVGTGAGNFDG